MQHKSLVITVALALVIATVGIVLLHTDDTDANDSATPVGGIHASFASGPQDYSIRFRYNGPRGAILVVSDIAVCFDVVPGVVKVPNSREVPVEAHFGGGCTDAVQSWRITVDRGSDDDPALQVQLVVSNGVIRGLRCVDDAAPPLVCHAVPNEVIVTKLDDQ